MEKKLTFLEAYEAMLTFLNNYYFNFGQDNLGSILSSIHLKDDGTTFDPAAWIDWLEAIEETINK